MSDARTDRRDSVTIRDVAEEAGVATSTVSRALSKPDRVSPRTRERVEAIAKRLGYVPSSQARALSSGRTGAIALLVPDVTNPFYFDVIRGTQLALKAVGYTQLLVDTEESAEVELETFERLSRSSDGIVLTASRLADAVIERAAERMPIVTINRTVADVPTVVIDTPGSIGQALEHLASLGHRRVAYASGPKRSWSNALRWKALEGEAPRLGIELVRIGPFAPKTTSGAAAADVALHARVTAAIAFNDLIAIGMLTRLAQRGVSVPNDFSVIGCDDIFGADFAHPALTTITAPIEQAGRVAISMLMSRIDGAATPVGNRQVTVLPTHLTIRQSTGPAPSPAVI